MTSNFDWSKYEEAKPSAEQKATTVEQDNTFNWKQYEQKSTAPTYVPPKSFTEQSWEDIKQVPSGLARIGLRGGAAGAAASSKAIGGLLHTLSSMGTEGKPGEFKGMGTRMIKTAGDYFQKLGKEGQAQLKQGIESLLGQSYSTGEEALAQGLERIANIYGSGPFKGMGIPSIIGGAAGQIGKELGTPESVQTGLEIFGTMGKDLAKGIASLAKQPRYSKSGLQLPSIVEKTGEKLSGLKAKVFGGKKEQVYNKVSDQAEKLITKIKQERLPLTKEIEEGIDVTARTQKNLEDVQTLANKMTDKIESTTVSNYLDDIENTIQFGGVPTGEQEEILKLVNKYREKFGEFEGGKRLYTPSQYVKQFRNINKDLTNLYQTKFVHGERLDTMRFYEGLKDKITKTLEQGTPEAFSNLFKETNKEFSQLSRIDRFNQIMEQVTSETGIINANKLQNYITDPRKANILRKQIGKEGFDKLRLISNDLSKVQNKLKLVEELNLGSAIKSGLAMKVFAMLKLPVVAPVVLSTKGAQVARGYMLTSPQGTRDVTNLLKAIHSGNKKAIRSYVLKLDENAKKYEEAKNPK